MALTGLAKSVMYAPITEIGRVASQSGIVVAVATWDMRTEGSCNAASCTDAGAAEIMAARWAWWVGLAFMEGLTALYSLFTFDSYFKEVRI